MMSSRYLWVCVFALTAVAAEPDWSKATAGLVPGQRLEVESKGQLVRGLFVLSNSGELLVTVAQGDVRRFAQPEVDRITRYGAESPKLTYVQNAREQMFPQPEVLFERPGAPAPLVKKKHKRWRPGRG